MADPWQWQFLPGKRSCEAQDDESEQRQKEREPDEDEDHETEKRDPAQRGLQDPQEECGENLHQEEQDPLLCVVQRVGPIPVEEIGNETEYRGIGDRRAPSFPRIL